MTKKDFDLIAGILSTYNTSLKDLDYKVSGNHLLREITLVFANSLQQTNARFDIKRFIKACGIEL